MKTPSVLISVLNFNDFLSTKKCVESLNKYIKDGEEILVIDNNSPDNSFKKLKNNFNNIKIIKSKINGGYASGHKIAVEYAIHKNFELLWILNNDLTVREDTLSELISAYLMHGVGIYGSISLKSEKPDIINFGGGSTEDISKPFNYNDYENFSLKDYNIETRFRAVQSVEGSSLLIPTKIIKKHGFMSEQYFMYGEETDYCYRLKRLGIKSYVVPKSIVIHKGSESMKGKYYLEAYYRRRNFLYFEKNNYGISIVKNIHRRVGIMSLIKFFIYYLLKYKNKDYEYYLNLGNLHALINKKGKLKE